MRKIKTSIKYLLRKSGYEICQLSESEKLEIPMCNAFTYKEAQCFRALASAGQISFAEARFLTELVKSSDPARPIIEIGTLFGHSTIVMALAKDPGQQLITVDNFSWNPLGLSADAHYAIVRYRLAELTRTQNVQVLKTDKDEFYRGYVGPPPALFFCDADHSYEATRADLLWARSVGASIVCGDDYLHASQQGVTQIVDELGGPKRLVDGLFLL